MVGGEQGCGGKCGDGLTYNVKRTTYNFFW